MRPLSLGFYNNMVFSSPPYFSEIHDVCCLELYLSIHSLVLAKCHSRVAIWAWEEKGLWSWCGCLLSA